MSGRIAIREGALADEPGVLRLAPVWAQPATEDSVRAAFRAALAAAAARDARVVALGVEPGGGVPLQRRAELLFDEARRHLDGATTVEEVRFVVAGEPAYRVFESVQDAARIAAQMERLRRS